MVAIRRERSRARTSAVLRSLTVVGFLVASSVALAGAAEDCKAKIRDEGVKACNLAIDADPTSAELFVLRGMKYASIGDYERAIQDLNRATALDPKDAAAHDVLRGFVQFVRAKRQPPLQEFPN